MSLEDLRKDWEAIDGSTMKNQLSNEQIKTILKKKHRSFFFKTLILEVSILLMFLYFIVLITFRFDELEKSYLEILAVISIGILGLFFIIRAIQLLKIFRNEYLNNSHSVVLKKMTKRRIRIKKLYLLNIVTGFFLLIILIILCIKIYNEYDLIQNKYFWLTIIPSSFIFIILFNKWIKKYYFKGIREAEELLKELE